jgi:hypothetical protein
MIAPELLLCLGRTPFYVIFVLIALVQRCPAEPRTVRVISEDRSPLSGMLVIVRRWESGPLKEMGRYLSGTDGKVPEIPVAPGLYQIVAVNPYGPYDTAVEDVLGERWNGTLDVIMKVKPLINSYNVGMPKVSLAFQAAEKEDPADFVSWCLFRSRDAQIQSWVRYRSDDAIELPDELTYAACIVDSRLFRFVIASEVCSPEFLQGAIPCYSVKDGKVVVPLKSANGK